MEETKLCTLYELASARLSSLQLEILSSMKFGSAGNLTAIMAAAGSGKTRLLSFLVGRALLDEAVSDVYLLSTTRAAKLEAYERCTSLQLELGENMATKLLRNSNVRTIHSVAFTWAKYAFNEKNIEIVSKSTIVEQIKIFLQEELSSSESTHSSGALTAFQLAESDVVANMDLGAAAELLYEVRAERLRGLQPIIDSSFGRTAERVLSRLQDLCFGKDSESMLLDFDLMINLLALSSESILHKGCVLFVDETQDCSFAQLRVLMNSLKAGVQIVALGDARQGIFGFSGACANTFSSLFRMCDQEGASVKKLELYQNHRSTHAIVKASELFLFEQDRVGNEKITGNGNASHPVELAICHDEACVVSKRIVELVKNKICSPGDIVVLRHQNFGPKDDFVTKLQSEAKKQNVLVEDIIFGFDQNNSLSVRVASIVKIAIGIERFLDTPDEAIYHIKSFFKALRGVSVDVSLAAKAIEHVWNERKCSPWNLFVKFSKQLEESFLVFLDESERKKEAAQLRQPLPKRAKKAGRDSLKFKNFRSAIEKVALTMQSLNTAMQNVFNSRIPLGRLSVEKCPIPKHREPKLKTPLGGFVWLVITDLVNYKFDAKNEASDDAEILDLIWRYERSGFEDFDGDFSDFVVDKTSQLLEEKMNKNASDKVVFSTIHKYKGRERPVVFSVNVRAPWYKPSWAQRATLTDTHRDGCSNTSGRKPECGCSAFTSKVQELVDAGNAEKARLLYVAASRAKERLFVTCSANEPRAEAFDKMAPQASFNINCWTKWVPP